MICRSWKFPLSALVAAAIRWACVTAGLGLDYGGDILGEEQWKWLELQLQQDPRPSVTIIVSSIQVLTSNPVFESWMHFPQAKQRLLRLLEAYKPNHLVLISGDVHHSEVCLH